MRVPTVIESTHEARLASGKLLRLRAHPLLIRRAATDWPKGE